MITLQEQFEKDFPDKSTRETDVGGRIGCKKTNFTNYDLDLREKGELVKARKEKQKNLLNKLDLFLEKN